MITAHLTEPGGRRHTVQARAGTSLMRAAVDAGVQGIAADCGGCLTCATCHVYVDEAWLARLAPPDADEQAMLEMTASERGPGSRLSCQIALVPELNGLQVTLPATQY